MFEHYVGRDTYQDISWDHHFKCCLASWCLLKDCYKSLLTYLSPKISSFQGVTLSTKLEWTRQPPTSPLSHPPQAPGLDSERNELEFCWAMLGQAMLGQYRPGQDRCISKTRFMIPISTLSQITIVLITGQIKTARC